MGREIKFRQKLKPAFVGMHGESFHYWGFIDGGFVSPLGENQAENKGDQYIGQKDERGVEICEGDTATKDYGDGDPMFGQVVWSDREAGFVLRCDEDLDICLNKHYTSHGFVVTGNIYEQKEE